MISITNYNNNGDWFYILAAVCVVDTLAVAFSKYPGSNPYFKVSSLNNWYGKFGILAFASDVCSISIGIMFARYIFSYMRLSNTLYFLAIIVLFQLFHDALFYYAVILPLPHGHNQMIDVFKNYANENGSKILGADALLLVGSTLLASFLKSIPDHYTVATFLTTIYSVIYFIHTKSP